MLCQAGRSAFVAQPSGGLTTLTSQHTKIDMPLRMHVCTGLGMDRDCRRLRSGRGPRSARAQSHKNEQHCMMMVVPLSISYVAYVVRNVVYVHVGTPPRSPRSRSASAGPLLARISARLNSSAVPLARASRGIFYFCTTFSLLLGQIGQGVTGTYIFCGAAIFNFHSFRTAYL